MGLIEKASKSFWWIPKTIQIQYKYNNISIFYPCLASLAFVIEHAIEHAQCKQTACVVVADDQSSHEGVQEERVHYWDTMTTLLNRLDNTNVNNDNSILTHVCTNTCIALITIFEWYTP